MNANVKMKIVDERLYNEAAWLMDLDTVEMEDINSIAIVRSEEDHRGIDLSEMLSLLVEQVFAYDKPLGEMTEDGQRLRAFPDRPHRDDFVGVDNE